MSKVTSFSGATKSCPDIRAPKTPLTSKTFIVLSLIVNLIRVLLSELVTSTVLVSSFHSTFAPIASNTPLAGTRVVPSPRITGAWSSKKI